MLGVQNLDVLWVKLDECIRPTFKYPNETDSKITYNQEILKFVKICFLQQKNPNFFVKQVIYENDGNTFQPKTL